MAETVNLNPIQNLQNDTTVVNTINSNNTTITTAFSDVLSRTGSAPNQMNAALDMNNNHILNLPIPSGNFDVVRLIDLNNIKSGGSITVSTLPAGGVAGTILTKRSGTDFDAVWSVVAGNGVNAVALGADPTGTNDSSAAINTYLASNPGATIYFPRGTYKMNSQLTVTLGALNCCALYGDGQDATILNWPNASGGIVFNYNSQFASMAIREMTLTTAVATGGDAIKLNNLTTTLIAPTSYIYNVTIRATGTSGYVGANVYWTNAINIVGVSQVNIDNTTVYGGFLGGVDLGNGIIVNGIPANSQYSVVINISKCILNNLAVGFLFGNFVQGVTIDQTNFLCMQSIVSNASQTGSLQQLYVTNSQMISFLGGGANVNLQSPIGQFTFVNNLITQGGTTTGGLIFGAANCVVMGNTIQVTPSSTAVPITVLAGSGAVISNNYVFNGVNGGVVMNASTALVEVHDNNIVVNSGSPVINNGSSTLNSIYNNNYGGQNVPNIDNGKAGNICQTVIYDNAIAKWIYGKDASNNFFLSDVTNGVTSLKIPPGSASFNTITNGIVSSSPTTGIGYTTGAGGTVVQATSRSTGVTLNKVAGAITLVSAAGSATPTTFTLTNSVIASTDVILFNQATGTDKYEIFVTNVANGSCQVTFFTTGGTTTETPAFSFVVIKGTIN